MRGCTHADADEDVALLHLLEVCDGDIVGLERRQLELAVGRVDKP